MSHDIMVNDEGLPMAVFVRGRGTVKSVWHQNITGVEVLPLDTFEPGLIPARCLGDVRVVSPIDPETFDPVEGLGLIKVAGRAIRLGHAGGRKRVNWTPAQPTEILATLDRLREAGASIEGVMWLDPGRFLVEGQLPVDQKTAETFGEDRHDVRFCAIANYTGQGSDLIVVSLTRVVCANTERAALYSANKAGTVLRIRHAADVADRWDIDVPAFLGDYSAKIAERAEVKADLGAMSLGDNPRAIIQERDALFSAMIRFKRWTVDKRTGERKLVLAPLPTEGKGATFYRRKVEALRTAWHAERDNAASLGIDPNSRRVAFEAFTNVQSHGGVVTVDDKAKDAADRTQWRPVLNGARTEAGRALSLLTSDAADNALSVAMAPSLVLA